MSIDICRIAIFFDGTYFSKVSNYYLYQHDRKSRISIKGLHEFILHEVSKNEGVDAGDVRSWTLVTSAASFPHIKQKIKINYTLNEFLKMFYYGQMSVYSNNFFLRDLMVALKKRELTFC